MDRRILSIVEAKIDEGSWLQLIKEYEQVEKSSLPSAVLSAYLTQDKTEPALWRIVTIWENLEAMKEYRKSVATPIWIQIFENAGATPNLIISEVKSSK